MFLEKSVKDLKYKLEVAKVGTDILNHTGSNIADAVFVNTVGFK